MRLVYVAWSGIAEKHYIEAHRRYGNCEIQLARRSLESSDADIRS